MINKLFLSGIFIVVLSFAVSVESADWLNYVEGKGGDMVFRHSPLLEGHHHRPDVAAGEKDTLA